VVIISDAHAMNPEASNALLKILEEPPDKTIFILTTDHIRDLLPTVVSRCHPVRFKPISREHLRKLLVDRHHVDPNEASIIAAAANGSLSRAVEMCQSNWIRKRRWIIGEMKSLASKPAGFLLAFAEALTQDKAFLPDAFDVMIIWLRDLLFYQFSPERIMNKDVTDDIQCVSHKFSVAALLSKINLIQNAQKDIQANANLRLTLESLVFRLAQTECESCYQREKHTRNRIGV
jgi:DNA polymerase-3 subunit delta'